jgi:hypothetical protein
MPWWYGPRNINTAKLISKKDAADDIVSAVTASQPTSNQWVVFDHVILLDLPSRLLFFHWTKIGRLPSQEPSSLTTRNGYVALQSKSIGLSQCRAQTCQTGEPPIYVHIRIRSDHYPHSPTDSILRVRRGQFGLPWYTSQND